MPWSFDESRDPRLKRPDEGRPLRLRGDGSAAVGRERHQAERMLQATDRGCGMRHDQVHGTRFVGQKHASRIRRGVQNPVFGRIQVQGVRGAVHHHGHRTGRQRTNVDAKLVLSSQKAGRGLDQQLIGSRGQDLASNMRESHRVVL
jgi:hypothetical protein